MALINCPECEKEISNKAKQCPKCGYPIENIEEFKPIYIEQVTPNIAKPKHTKVLIVTAVIFLALLFAGYQYTEYQIKKEKSASEKEWKPWTSKELNKKKNVKTTFTNNEAAYAAQQFVKKKLKVPSSADFDALFKSNDFDALFKSKISRKGSEYTVIGYVESQNNFGTKVRSRYVAVIKRNSSGGVSLLDLVIE